MLNVIWLGMIVIGVIVAMFTGNLQAVTDAAISSAETAVELSIGLIGVMSLWLGIMAIAEKAGMIKSLGKGLNPIMKKLFPEIPAEHPAMGAMIMNIAANILGLGNAATPFGIKAMQELETLNDHEGVATDAMVMFLAINTSSVTLIPATVIAMRSAAGSTNPTEVIGPIILTTTISTVSAIILSKLFAKRKKYKVENFIDDNNKDVENA